jgi:hypothetical protein
MKPTGISLAVLAALFLTASASARTQRGTDVQAITTSGSGEFHRCYKQFVVFHTTCAVHHVDVPEHIAVGDYVNLEYGSNPKYYTFHVSRIIREADRGCTVRSDSSESAHRSEKIEIGSCQPSSK